MSLSLRQWFGLAAAAPRLWEKVGEMIEILKEAGVVSDETRMVAVEPGEPVISAKDLVTNARSLTEEEERIFTRHGAE